MTQPQRTIADMARSIDAQRQAARDTARELAEAREKKRQGDGQAATQNGQSR